MNLTIPIRAQSSTSSWARHMRGSSSVNTIKADRKRYLFSMITATLLVGTLLAGSIGGIMQSASARDNFSSRNYYSPGSSQNRGASRSNQTTQTPSRGTTSTQTSTKTPPPATPVTPAAPQPAPTTPAPATAQTATPVVAKAPVTPQIVSAPTPVDTAPAIANMSSAQAEKNTQAVTYTSSKLSDETRNRILMLAGVATITGALLYTISFISVAAPVTRRNIPIRYIVPVREGIPR